MEQEYDVIIVGLGCVGLSAAHYLSKHGNLKVLGLEQYGKSGDIGSSSYGNGRIWRECDFDDKYVKMQREGREVWKDVEQECNEELLMKTGMLNVFSVANKSDIEMYIRQGAYEVSRTEIQKRFPEVKINEDQVCLWLDDAGVVRVQKALECFMNLSRKYGADLRYSSEVKEVDHLNKSVTLVNRQKFKAKRAVVISCGPFSGKFLQYPTQFEFQRLPVHCLELDSCVGFPPCFSIKDLPSFEFFYATTDGPDHKQFKIGVGHEKNPDLHESIKILERYIPTIQQKITGILPCFYTQSEEFIFEKRGGTIYAFSLAGIGFKHMGYHGKRVFHLLNDNLKEANKYGKDYVPKL